METVCRNIVVFLNTAFLWLAVPTFAGSAQWNLNPSSGDWNTVGNWTPPTVPNGSADTATFSLSNTTSVFISTQTEVGSIVFLAGGTNAYTVTANTGLVLTISGTGITNNSGKVQSFVTEPDINGLGFSGRITFGFSATAGNFTTFANRGAAVAGNIGGSTEFLGTSTAGDATFLNQGSDVGFGGSTAFIGNSTAGDATVVNNSGASGGGVTQFFGAAIAGNGTFVNNGSTSNTGAAGETTFGASSSAGNATFTNHAGTTPGAAGAFTLFFDNATADNGTFINEGARVAGASGGLTLFSGSPSFPNRMSTAGNGTFTNNGGAVNGAFGGTTLFLLNSTAANGTFLNNGGTTASAFGGITKFADSSSASTSTLIAHGGSAGGGGGRISFAGDSTGDFSRVELFGNGELDISAHNPGAVTLGSIEGDGNVFLGNNELVVGGNSLSTEFSGVIRDGGLAGGVGGSLAKVLDGTLILNGANTYTGGTFVNGGTLLVNNTSGSGTGTGAVHVNDGATLGGNGKIAGPVVIGAPLSPSAILSPGAGAGSIGALTIQSTLTFLNGSLNFELNSNAATADEIIANGVTISPIFGIATFSFLDLGNGVLAPGSEFTVIDNTAASAISGTFNNLADGSIFSGGLNTYRVNYEGGDGNDLTLQVASGQVPDGGTTLSLLMLAFSGIALLRRFV
jgi:hypothetical protein